MNYHTGETMVQVHRHKRRREIAQLLQALLDKHPHEIVYVDVCVTTTPSDPSVPTGWFQAPDAVHEVA